MKNLKKIIIGLLLLLGTFIPINIKFRLVNVESIFKQVIINLFPQQIIKRGDLDEVWDFDKTLKPDSSGYYDWRIGLKDNKLTAVRSVTDSTVMFTSEPNMNFKSKSDYYGSNGPAIFRVYIEKNNR